MKLLRPMSDKIKPTALGDTQDWDVLWAHASSGDMPAYEQMLSGLARIIRGFVRRRMDVADDQIEDIVQDVLMAVHHKRHTKRTETPCLAWVMGIARHKLLDFQRRAYKSRGRQQQIEHHIHELMVPPSQLADQAKQDLEVVMESLKPCEQDALLSVYVHGLSIKEEASRTGRSASATKVALHRSMSKLKNIWDQRS
ncbi:MAG: RNA polymerase subunit sigma [Rhodobacteraceae bacterium]|nr:RNA polymerase subunit sigma [Paracoccaceae bacterium]